MMISCLSLVLKVRFHGEQHNLQHNSTSEKIPLALLRMSDLRLCLSQPLPQPPQPQPIVFFVNIS